MSISPSAPTSQRVAATAAREGDMAPPITLSERSGTGLALLRFFVGYLWFQQLFRHLALTGTKRWHGDARASLSRFLDTLEVTHTSRREKEIRYGSQRQSGSCTSLDAQGL
jgi:hypothetical protein